MTNAASGSVVLDLKGQFATAAHARQTTRRSGGCFVLICPEKERCVSETRKLAPTIVADVVGCSCPIGAHEDRILAGRRTLLGTSPPPPFVAAMSSRRIALRQQSFIRFALLTLALLLFSISLPPSRVQAQNACVLIPDKQNPISRILRCGSTLTVQPAPGSSYRPVDTAGSRPPDSVQLDGGALLIDFHGSKTLRDFQVLTPEAIASVRGTRWAMEVEPGQTSVLGLAGTIQVARVNNRADLVVLRQGEGVDVGLTGEPLQVKRWAAQRVQALLARFGK